MASEANTKRAEELVVTLLGYVHESDARGLAEVLDAAEQRGREEEREGWRRKIEEAVHGRAVRWERTCHERGPKWRVEADLHREIGEALSALLADDAKAEEG